MVLLAVILPIDSYAASGNIICSRYGLVAGTEEFKQCVNSLPDAKKIEPQRKDVSPNLSPLRIDSTKMQPIQVDIGKLIVSYQPDADAYYPSFSKRSGEQGEVVIRLTIDPNGNVEDVAILRSSNYPRLDRAAIEIGQRYKFKPYIINGTAIRVSTNLLIKFNLKSD